MVLWRTECTVLKKRGKKRRRAEARRRSDLLGDDEPRACLGLLALGDDFDRVTRGELGFLLGVTEGD
nr:hypothetical protein [uncultured Mediterranean phage uvMED]